MRSLRKDDPAIGRFLAPDTIVPEPGNPQALNRYMYVLGNPLRYTDPTGMFSEDEIMRYLGVSTWDEVLAMFGEGGAMAGAWGFLEVLRQAELGTPIAMWFDASNGFNAGQPHMVGSFYEQDGALVFSAAFVDWTGAGGSWALGGLSVHQAAKLVPATGQYQVGSLSSSGAYISAARQYKHVKFEEADDIDWFAAGIDVASIAADLVTFGVGGRLIKGIEVGTKARDVGRALNWIDLGYTMGGVGQAIAGGSLSVDEGKSLSYSVAGFVPGVGTGASIVSLLDNILKLEP